VKGAIFADAGSLWDYRGPESWNVTGETLNAGSRNMIVRSSVGVGLIWNSPFGPLRFDYAYPITKWCGNVDPITGIQACDRVQQFRFGGGTKF
jgi:outer membrane protein insertion porin family